VHSVLKVPVAIQAETLISFHYVAISLPVVISLAGLRGLVGAYQRFDLLSAVRVPISLFSYLVPLVVLPFSKTLGPFILVLVLSRFLAWFIHLFLCFQVSPALRRRITIKGAPFRHMFSFGGWMTVTNVVSPIMVSMDRLLIGALISMTAVAYYATPYEAASKLWIIPSSVAGVLFPAFATALARDRQRAALLYEKGVKYIFLAMFPIVLCVLAFGSFALHIWLGTAFVENSKSVLQLLVLGVFANSLAQVPFWQIQAAGRPDLAAKVHLIELPCYLLIFWSLTTRYGIQGAGIAWMLRATVDACIMFWLSYRLLPESRAALWHLTRMCMAATPVFVVAVLIHGKIAAAIYVVITSLATLAITWFYLLTGQEREVAANPLRLLAYRPHDAVNAMQSQDHNQDRELSLSAVSSER